MNDNDLIGKQIGIITNMLGTIADTAVNYQCNSRNWSIEFADASSRPPLTCSYATVISVLQARLDDIAKKPTKLTGDEIDRITQQYENFKQNTVETKSYIWMMSDRHTFFKLPSPVDDRVLFMDCVKYITMVLRESAWSVFIDKKVFHHDYNNDWLVVEEKLSRFVDSLLQDNHSKDVLLTPPSPTNHK